MILQNYIKQNSVWDEKAEKLYEAQRLCNYYTKLSIELKKELLQLSKEQNSVGSAYVFHHFTRLGPINYSKIPELKIINLEEYRKDDIVIWKLENIGNKALEKIEI